MQTQTRRPVDELARQAQRTLLAGGQPRAGPAAELVDTFLGAGSALSGMQPKVMVPVGDKVVVSAPNVIIKTEGARYPGLSANEWMCLTAARCAGLTVPPFDLSADGQLLVVDRFDILDDGTRLGFEDMAALMQLRVRDRLSSRKYIGSYEDIAAALRLVCTRPAEALAQFFGYLVLSVLVRNGVIESVDRTMALKLRRGGRSGEASRARAYPGLVELQDFGREVCGVYNPAAVVGRVQEGMRQALALAEVNTAVPGTVRRAMAQAWRDGGLAGHSSDDFGRDKNVTRGD